MVYDNILLPELEADDLVVSTDDGCLHQASATEFNFFPKTRIIEVD